MLEWKFISRYLTTDIKEIIDPIIQRNGYFAAAENILLSMLCNERKHIRDLGLCRLLKARAGSLQFQKSTLTLRITLIWSHGTSLKSQSPQWQISNDSLKQFIRETSESTVVENPLIDFLRFPCHTQAVERVIKLVTESPLSLCGSSSREGFIKAKIISQRNMPKFDTKMQFNVPDAVKNKYFQMLRTLVKDLRGTNFCSHYKEFFVYMYKEINHLPYFI